MPKRMPAISHESKRKIKKGLKVLALSCSIFGIIFTTLSLRTIKDKLLVSYLSQKGLISKPVPEISPEKAARLQALYRTAGRKYNIPAEYLKAINKVETDFGRNTGQYRVLDVLRASERDEFHQICAENGMNALSVKGSSAGAIGFMQFMPSTWQKYKDASGNLPYNPWDEEDSIFAAARLLAENGGKEEMYRAIFNYNPDPDYVDEVTRLARLYSRNSKKNRTRRASAGAEIRNDTGADAGKSTAFDLNEPKHPLRPRNIKDDPNIRPTDIKINWWFDQQLDFGWFYKSAGPSHRELLLTFLLAVDEFQNNTTETVRTSLATLVDKIEEKF